MMGPPAVARCKVGPSQCHSQATPLEVCVCAVRVSSPSPGCTWLWPQKCLQPQNCQLWEELSPGQELLGAGDSAAMLSKGCCARCRSTARSSSSASQSQQQLRSIHSSPGLWPGSPPHPRQHVVKLQPQPVAPRRNLCGFRGHKCQRGICWPWGPPDPSDQGGCGSWPVHSDLAQACPAPGHRAAYPHTRTSDWLSGVPSFVSFITAGLHRAALGHCGLGVPCAPWIPLSCAGTAVLWGAAMLRGGEGLLVQQSGCGWVEGSAEWMGPSQERSQAAPPIPVYSVSTSVSHAERQTCVFV